MWTNGDFSAHGRVRSGGDIQCKGNMFVAGYLAVRNNIHANDGPAWDKAQW
jgi:hypothetical protein